MADQSLCYNETNPPEDMPSFELISVNTHMDISKNYQGDDMMIRAMESTISTKLSYKRKTVKNIYFMESYVLQQNPFKLFTVSRGDPDVSIVE